jgi:formylglycine-generating enzyme required for sulfatase activity
MRKPLLTLIMTIVVSHAAAAPPSVESIETLLAITRSEAVMDSAYSVNEPMMRQSMQQVMKGKSLTPEQQRFLDGFPAKLTELMKAELNWDKLRPQIIEIYRDSYDQEEVDGMIAFYRSKAGQSFLTKMPVVVQKTMAITLSQMQTIMPKLKAIAEQFAKDMKLANSAIPLDPKPPMVKDCDVCPDLVALPDGSFDMGSSEGDADAKPLHRVNLKGFMLGQTEVTYGQWKALMGAGTQSQSACGDECPVRQVSWGDAQLFVQKLSERTGKKYRLPSEAEWEYAARAGGTGRWSFGDDESQLDKHAWYGANSLGASKAGGQRRQNAFGLQDMHGNVWEWVQDVWHPNYDGAPSDGAAWVGGGDQELRVLRGGAWFDKPASLQSSYRSWNTAVVHYYGAGLRVARDRE